MVGFVVVVVVDVVVVCCTYGVVRCCWSKELRNLAETSSKRSRLGVSKLPSTFSRLRSASAFTGSCTNTSALCAILLSCEL